MITVIKKKKKKQTKTGGPKSSGTTRHGYVLLPTPGRSKETAWVWKLAGSRTQWGEDNELKPRCGNVKTVQSCGPHFWVISENGSHARREPLKMEPVNKHVRTPVENQEENSRSVSALFLLKSCCFSLSS